MLEAAQETMAGMLDFARLAAHVMAPMGLFAIPNAPSELADDGYSKKKPGNVPGFFVAKHRNHAT